jgi:hypothetical protein
VYLPLSSEHSSKSNQDFELVSVSPCAETRNSNVAVSHSPVSKPADSNVAVSDSPESKPAEFAEVVVPAHRIISNSVSASCTESARDSTGMSKLDSNAVEAPLKVPQLSSYFSNADDISDLRDQSDSDAPVKSCVTSAPIDSNVMGVGSGDVSLNYDASSTRTVQDRSSEEAVQAAEQLAVTSSTASTSVQSDSSISARVADAHRVNPFLTQEPVAASRSSASAWNLPIFPPSAAAATAPAVIPTFFDLKKDLPQLDLRSLLIPCPLCLQAMTSEAKKLPCILIFCAPFYSCSVSV